MRRRWPSLAMAGFALLGAAPNGPEFQVNATTSGNEVSPSIAMSGDGQFVVVWGANWGGDITGQRFKADGSRLGAEFVVAAATHYPYFDYPRRGDVSMDADGDFVVVWESQYANPISCYTVWDDVYIRQYDHDGAPGPLKKIPGNAGDNQRAPHVWMGPSGDFSVVWASNNGCACPFPPGCGGGPPEVRLRRYAANGTMVGTTVVVNDLPTAWRAEGISGDASGNFVIVFDASTGLWGQRVSASGAKLGPNFSISSQSSADAPRVASGFAGAFAIAWVEGSPPAVWGRKYRSDGTPETGPFAVSSAVSPSWEPALTIGPTGDTLIAWTGGTTGTGDVFGRTFSGNGTPLTGEFRINVTTAGDQRQPSVAFDGAGRYTTVWESNALGIRARGSAASTQKLHVGIGPGPSSANPPLSATAVYDAATQSVVTSVFTDASGAPVYHYGTLAAGVNVGGGNVAGTTAGEFLTGPGSVAPFGPHVRAWAPDGSSISKVNFFAYGTLMFGVKVRGAQVDGDAYHEIVTGAGNGQVFGPHVRGFDFDGATLQPISRINFFAYDPASYRYGVNVEGGDLEGDGTDELVTGTSSGAGYSTWLKAWRANAQAPITELASVNPVFASANAHGVTVATGDLDGDMLTEVLVGRGPGPGLDATIRVLRYDAPSATFATLSEIATVAFPSGYGVNLAGLDAIGTGRDQIYAAPGPDPTAPAALRGFTWPGPGVDLAPMSGFWDVEPFGGVAPAAAYGATLGVGFQ